MVFIEYQKTKGGNGENAKRIRFGNETHHQAVWQ